MKKKDIYDVIYKTMEKFRFLDEEQTTEDCVAFKAYGGVDSIGFYQDYFDAGTYLEEGLRIHCDDITEVTFHHKEYGSSCTLWLSIRFGPDGRNRMGYEFDRREEDND